MSTTDGSNAAGPAFSTVAYSSVLSNPSNTVPKSSAASESCGVACTVTTARPPLPPATLRAGIAAGRHRVERDHLAGLRQRRVAVCAGHAGRVGAVEHTPDAAQHELGDEQVTVTIATAAGALARQQVGRVGDECDLAAVGVDRRRPRAARRRPRAARAARRRRRPPTPAPAAGAATARRRSRCRRCRGRTGTPATGSRGCNASGWPAAACGRAT